MAKHRTAHNSGVIHSGIYYQPRSLKARNCRRGYGLLLEFCEKHNVEFEIYGKIVLATNESELSYLDVLYERGQKNGLENLKKITREEIHDLEPHARGIAGIYVPQTGIVDFVQAAQRLERQIVSHGAQIYLGSRVIKLNTHMKHVEIIASNNILVDKTVVNCAGLHSDRIAKLTNLEMPLRIIPFRGEYYKLK